MWLDILLLQELHFRRQGSGYVFVGLGTGKNVVAMYAQRPWAAVVACNLEFQIMFVLQLSTTHCACTEVRAPGFSFYVASCYFHYSDETEKHLKHLKMVLRSLREQMVLRVPKVGSEEQRTKKIRFNTNRADWEKFAESLVDLSGSRLEVLGLTSVEDVVKFADALAGSLMNVCGKAIPKKRQFRKSNLLLKKNLTIKKKIDYRDIRTYQQKSVELIRSIKLRVYRSSLREYTRELRKAKLECWQKFVTDQGKSKTWGFVYKPKANKVWVDKVLSTLSGGNSSTVTTEETAARLLDVHVPDDGENEDTLQQREIRDSKSQQLSDLWKQQGASAGSHRGLEGSLRIFLNGENTDVEDPKSYSPISLLSVMGKLFEKLLLKRLNQTSLSPGKISDQQFGFTPGRLTDDAVVELRRMVSASEQRYVIALLFDISGAFDNVWWPLILSGF
ncbi:PREDICTED: uncharacterized protein LOC106741720 [Dinoponera quadriceps]|uniref:Uncharacterized protein LOC106741720 n=1 Tax=Dinoponera quadriceps TaxID=609295 RepID=A0A6P3WTM8_DINQU|nr:PREDICTED: uncharacterized protein LOC106741720 [Dinoponera quadriceps]